MYDCKAPLSRFYYPETRRIIYAFIIIIIIYFIDLCIQFSPKKVITEKAAFKV